MVLLITIRQNIHIPANIHGSLGPINKKSLNSFYCSEGFDMYLCYMYFLMDPVRVVKQYVLFSYIFLFQSIIEDAVPDFTETSHSPLPRFSQQAVH